MDGHRTYPLRTVLFKGKPFKIILEAENGPSPLLAIANTLILKELIGLSASSDVITTSALQSLIATALRSAQIAHSSDPAESSRNIELSISRLHEFEQGLNLNLGFTRIDDYESSDRLVVFHTLGLEVVHGWLADPSEPASVVFQNDRLNSRTISEKRALGAGASAAEAYKLSLASGWLAMHSTQLTSFGLEQLRREIPSGSFRIFTRSNQYHCLYKHHENIFLLVTDPSVSSPAVWASPDPSHATVYYDAQFQALHGAPIFGTPPPKPNTSLLSPSPVDFSVPSSSSSSSIPSPSASASVAGQPKKVIIIENILSKEVKTLRLPRWPTTYEALRRFVQSLFKELPPSFSVTYRDPDDDFISITTAAEFDEAIRLATDTGSNELQIRVVPSFSSVVMSQLPVLPEQPAVPTPLPSTLPATPDKPVIPTPQPITPTTTIPSPSPTPVPVPIPVTPITPSTPVSPQPPTSSSVPPPRPLNLPPKEETDISTLVPQWFVDQVCSIFDRGNRYSPSLIIESLIRNAANVEETVAELKASGAKTIGGRRPNSFRFSPDFTTSLQQILNFLPFNPYVCASALILKGGSIPEAVLELTTNLGQYENMLTPQERSYGTEAAARPEDSTPNLSTPQPSVPIPQPVPQPTPVLPSPPVVISPVLPSKPSPPPVSSPHPIPHIVPTEISSSYPLDDSSSEERRIQLLEEQARQEAIRIEEAERKLQQERAEYYRRIEEKKTLQSKHLRTKLAVVEASLSESSTELIAAKARHSEAMSRRTELQAELASTQRSRIEAERALEELRRLESELSGSLRSTDNFISTMSATVEQLSSKVESTAAQKAKLVSQIDSVNSAPTPSSPSASLSMAPVSSSLASFSLPTSFLTSLNLLEAQGFIDHALNFELLIKHAGNLDATINELLQRQSSH